MVAKKYISLFTAISVSLLLGLSAYSQIDIASSLPLNVFPSPSPGGISTITTTQIPGASYTWTVNGRVRPEISGLGKNKAEFRWGKAGAVVTIAVEASHPIKGVRRGSETFVVSGLSLVWSADTYTPGWYKGKSLPFVNSTVTVAAIPEIILDGRRISNRELLFSWSANTDIEGESTGMGLDSIRLKMPTHKLQNVVARVRVEDASGRIVKEAAVSIESGRPLIAIYRSNPLGGVYNGSAVKSEVALPSGTFDFQAEPFFFPVKTKNELKYEWTVAGVDITGNPQMPSLLTVDAAGIESDSFRIDLSVEQLGDNYTFESKEFSVFIQ